MRECLEEAGHEVHELSHGLRIYRMLAEEHFDVVGVDRFMPGVSGAELIAMVRDTGMFLTLAFVLVSSAPLDQTKAVAVECGAHGAVSKDDAPNVLPVVVRHAERVAHHEILTTPKVAR